MSHEIGPQAADSAIGMEYPSALAALEDRQIFSILSSAGGFEMREQGRNEYFVRLLPRQLRELGEEIIALAKAALEPATTEPDLARPVERTPETLAPPEIWSARVTEEFQARFAQLSKAPPLGASGAPKPIKPWIKP